MPKIQQFLEDIKYNNIPREILSEKIPPHKEWEGNIRNVNGEMFEKTILEFDGDTCVLLYNHFNDIDIKDLTTRMNSIYHKFTNYQMIK